MKRDEILNAMQFKIDEFEHKGQKIRTLYCSLTVHASCALPEVYNNEYIENQKKMAAYHIDDILYGKLREEAEPLIERLLCATASKCDPIEYEAAVKLREIIFG